ncbi:hypothetical protein T02_562 [Trichinella nativa]|uniref:PAN domain protein n=1 Tax=Trichinella nativa TaxID=6335 RepID=A0A0V1KQP5_9BILA|nr:hypothetical protein T02_562 [Trichinella nativa]
MVSCDAIYYAENGHSCLCFYLSQNDTVEINSCKPENGNGEVYSYSDGISTFHDPVWTLNMCLHRCRGSMHVAILDILDREMERIDNPEPVNFYLKELRQICKVEFYVLKNLTQWKELKQLNNVTTFNKCLLSCIMESMRIPCSAINYSTSGECILLMNGGNDEFFKVKDGTLFGEIIDCELGNYVEQLYH